MAYANVTNALVQQQIPGVDPERMRNEVYRYELFGNTPGYAGISPAQYQQYTQALGVQGTGPGDHTSNVISSGYVGPGEQKIQPAPWTQPGGPGELSSVQPATQQSSNWNYPTWDQLTPAQRQMYGGDATSFDTIRNFQINNAQPWVQRGLNTSIDADTLAKLNAARAANPSGRVSIGESDAGQMWAYDPTWTVGDYTIGEDGSIGKSLKKETWGQDVGALYDAQGRLIGIGSGDSTALGLAKFGLASVGAYYGTNYLNGLGAPALSGWDAAMVDAGAGATTGAGGAAAGAGGAAAGAGGAAAAGQQVAQGAGSSAVSQAIQSGGPNPGNPSGSIFSNVRDAIPLVGAAATLASGGSRSTPQAPDYVKAAIATSNSGRYNEQTPYGTVTWSLRPGADPNNPQPGDYIRTTNFSPEQQRLYDLNTANQLQAGQVGGQQLADLGKGRQSVQDALYRRATQYYDQNFRDQENQLRARLANQGLNEGTEAFDRELRNFRQQRDTAYADAIDRAIAGANQQENDAVARIVNILNMSKATAPTSGNSAGGAGTDLLTAANQAYTANLGASNAQAARDAQQQNALLQLVLGGMKYYGG
jgi:hypothetical protein